jgi:hypothetical protein
MDSAAWKKIALRSVCFGAGFAIALALIAGGLYWLSERPKPWKSSAVTSSTPEVSVYTTEDAVRFRFQYPFKNNTNMDYTVPLPMNAALMRRVPDDGSLVKVDNVTWDPTLRIPAGQNVNLAFDITYKFSDYDTTLAELNAGAKMTDFWGKRTQEIDGFVFFDYGANYRIALPKNWD